MRSTELVLRSRRATRLSQVNFGQLLGVTPQHVSKWERGEAIPSTVTKKLLQLILDDPGGMVDRLRGLEAIADD